MKILVNHLTRMQPGYICVAGVEPQSGRHIRPTLGRRLTASLLAANGGPFGIAAEVDLGDVSAEPAIPEVEDHRFDIANVKQVKIIGKKDFWKVLTATSKKSLAQIFGKDLVANGNSMAVEKGAGVASLGVLAPIRAATLSTAFGKVKASFKEGTNELFVAVTDVRLYEADGTPRIDVVARLQKRINVGVHMLLSVGLARAWKKKGDTKERHFLQVNNIHLEDDPCWQG